MRLVFACLLLLLLAPAAAKATSVEVEESCDRSNCSYSMVVTAEPGEVNAITVTPEGEPKVALVVRDAGAGLRAGPRCEVLDAHAARCHPAGSLTVAAGDGDDTVDVAAASGLSASLNGGPGDDRLVAAPDAKLVGGAGLDTLQGGVALDYSSETEPVRIDLAAGTAVTSAGTERFAGIERVFSGRGDDALLGTESADILVGGPGDDRISGLGGADQLSGGLGRDVVRGGDGNDRLFTPQAPAPLDRGADRLDCGAGQDTADRADPPFVLDASCESLWVNTGDELRMRGGARPFLLLPGDLSAPPARVRATVRRFGARRVERRLRFAIRRYDVPGRRLHLTSKGLTAARRRGPVVVEVRIDAVDRADGGRVSRHAPRRLLIRLPRLGAS